jgi:hypothetical protein
MSNENETIDFTPTWSFALPIMLTAYANLGSKKRMNEADKKTWLNNLDEFKRMATAADERNKFAKRINEFEEAASNIIMRIATNDLNSDEGINDLNTLKNLLTTDKL